MRNWQATCSYNQTFASHNGGSCWQKFDHLIIRDVESTWKKEQIQNIPSEHLCGEERHHLECRQHLRNFWFLEDLRCGEAQKRKAALLELTHFQTPPNEVQKKPLKPPCPCGQEHLPHTTWVTLGYPAPRAGRQRKEAEWIPQNPRGNGQEHAVSKTLRHGSWDHGLVVNVAALGLWLPHMILRFFPHPK